MTDLGRTVLTKLAPVKFWFRRNAPQLLTGLGIVSMGAAVVTAIKQTPKANEILEQKNKDISNAKHNLSLVSSIPNYDKKEEDLNAAKKRVIKEYAKTAWEMTKVYAPSLICFSLGTASILTSSRIMKGRNAALAASLTLANEAFDKYREKVKEKLGEKAEQELYEKETKEVEVVNKNGKKETKKIKVPGAHGTYSLFYTYGCEGYHSNDNSSCFMNLKNAEDFATRKLKCEGYLLLSDVLKSLGVDDYMLSQHNMVLLKASKTCGWIYDENDPLCDNYVSFGITDPVTKQLTKESMDLIRYGSDGIWLNFNCDGDIINKVPGRKNYLDILEEQKEKNRVLFVEER